MWTVIKFKKQNFNLFKEDLKSKVGKDFIIYRPKILIQKYKKNKLINKEFEILGDYLFCYHKNFENKAVLNQLKFLKGVKYILNGFIEYQKDVKSFIDKCKKTEQPCALLCLVSSRLVVRPIAFSNTGRPAGLRAPADDRAAPDGARPERRPEGRYRRNGATAQL